MITFTSEFISLSEKAKIGRFFVMKKENKININDKQMELSISNKRTIT